MHGGCNILLSKYMLATCRLLVMCMLHMKSCISLESTFLYTSVLILLVGLVYSTLIFTAVAPVYAKLENL